MAETLNIYEIKTHFHKYVDKANQGSTIIICKSGKPWAKLAPLEAHIGQRKLGQLEGVDLGGDIFDELSGSDLDEWE